MNYNVKELRDNLSQHVFGLGIDSSFLSNPAFASAILEIDKLIGEMNIYDNSEKVKVKVEEGNISFDWTSSVGDKYSMSISSSSPETFRCVRTEEKHPIFGTNGQTIRQKNVVEEVTTIDESGFITLTTNGSMIDDINCEYGKCNNSTWAEKKYYTPNGVMRDREYKGFARGELTAAFDKTNIGSMLNIPRQAFGGDIFSETYQTRTLIRREKLDTARVVKEDKSKGIRYNATMPLNQEHGLRDMVLPGGYDAYPQDIVIRRLSQEEIESMIQRESNAKVAEGLREYAIGRDTYSYNSAYDEHFVCEGIVQSQGLSK